MYRTLTVEVKKEDPLFEYCDHVTKAVNNLRNATLFRMRQVLTMVEKSPDSLTGNEKEIYDELHNALPQMGGKYQMPTKGKTFLSYPFLYKLFKTTKNPDFFCEVLPSQTAQQTIKAAVTEMKSFYRAVRAYHKCPEKFTGKPSLPNYSKRGGNHTAIITNQESVLYYYDIKNGKQYKAEDAPADKSGSYRWELKLPLTTQRLILGKAPIAGKLKQVTITPTHGVFVVTLILDDGLKQPNCIPSQRICAIDIGVDNFAAITNNLGLPCLLFKGGVVKSINQYYNKRMAKIVSEQTKDGTEKFRPTDESNRLCLWRKHMLDDFIHKVAAMIIKWCVTNNIDTIVVGVNKFWKQKLNIGAVNNQNFVQIPFEQLRWCLCYLARRHGINYVEQEESYTSAASFVDGDYIPVYGVDDTNAVFSGKRGPTTYKGQHKPKRTAYRGIYRTKNGSYINSDLNGSANIGRKAFPELYAPGTVDFNHVEIIRHPDYQSSKLASKKNPSSDSTGKSHISKAKQHRLKKKSKK